MAGLLTKDPGPELTPWNADPKGGRNCDLPETWLFLSIEGPSVMSFLGVCIMAPNFWKLPRLEALKAQWFAGEPGYFQILKGILRPGHHTRDQHEHEPLPSLLPPP